MTTPLTYMRADRGAWCVDGLRDLINELPCELSMAEVGVFAGEASRLFIAAGQVAQLYAVDPWTDYDAGDGWQCPWPWGYVRRTFLDWAQGEPRVIAFSMTSLDAAACFAPQSLDFVYIDAVHTYPHVIADLMAWAPKVKAAGFIGGHDYSTAFPGVMRAVSEACARPMTFRDTSWLFRKTELRL